MHHATTLRTQTSHQKYPSCVWSSKTIWPVGWSPGKIISNLWEPISIKMLCLSPIQLHLKATNPRVVLFGTREEKGRENGRTKVNAWEMPGKTEVGRKTIKLAVTRSRFHSLSAAAFALWPQMTRVFVIQFLKCLKKYKDQKSVSPNSLNALLTPFWQSLHLRKRAWKGSSGKGTIDILQTYWESHSKKWKGFVLDIQWVNPCQ